MDRGAWWATVHGVSKSQTRLSDPHFHTLTFARFTRRYFVPGADMPQGPSAAWMSAGRRAKAQGLKPEVVGSISFFSLLSPFPLTPRTPPPPTFSHTPATATLASTLPGVGKVSSPKSRATLSPLPFSFCMAHPLFSKSSDITPTTLFELATPPPQPFRPPFPAPRFPKHFPPRCILGFADYIDSTSSPS